MTVVYSENKASLDDLRGLLYKTTNYFSPPLHSTVNISDYAKKMRKFAYTSEAWCSSLIGIVSCYLNNYVTYEGFITYVCVLRKFQRKHIVSNLMSMLFKKAYEMSFFNISLEVSKVNEGAILLYKQNGFVIANTTETVYTMKKLLSTPPPRIQCLFCIDKPQPCNYAYLPCILQVFLYFYIISQRSFYGKSSYKGDVKWT